LLALSLACRSASPLAWLSPVSDENFPARKAREWALPSLKQLIKQHGFRQIVAHRPYFLGYSENGEFVALLAGDPDGGEIHLQVMEPGSRRPVAVFRLPDGKALGETGDEDENLELVRGMVQRGYRILVPARPSRLEPGQPHELVDGWAIWTERGEGVERAVIRDEDGRLWNVSGDIPAFQEPMWEIFRLPGPNRKWLLAVTTFHQGQYAVMVYKLDLSRVASSAPDRRLLEECSARLHAPCRIAFRSWEGQGWTLTVSEERRAGHSPEFLYQGVAGRFAVFSLEGDVLAAGGERGFIEKGKPVSTDRKRVGQYRVELMSEPEKADFVFLVADAYDSGGRLLRTMEWTLGGEDGKFRRIGGGES
jgi:hypothetical protein